MPIDAQLLTKSDIDGLISEVAELKSVVARLADSMNQKLDNALPNDFVTAEAAAELAGVHVKTILNWSKEGRLTNYGKGRRRLFSKKEVLGQKK